MRIIDSKKERGLCVAYRCKNKHSKRDRFCPKHSKRWQKEKNPIAYTFHVLRSNARRRGKAFNLTLEEFKAFCKQTGYIELKGKKANSASIDRIDDAKGYEAGNLQLLTLRQNTQKRNNCPF